MRKRVLHLIAVCFFTSGGGDASAQEALVRPGDPMHPDTVWGRVWRVRKGSEVTHCERPSDGLSLGRFEKPLSEENLAFVNQLAGNICRELSHCEETVAYEQHILALDKFVNKLSADNEEKISKAAKPPELRPLYEESKKLSGVRLRLRFLAWRLGYVTSPISDSPECLPASLMPDIETEGVTVNVSQLAVPSLSTRSKTAYTGTAWKLEQRFTGFQFQGFGGSKSGATIDLAPNKFHLAWKNSKAQMLVMAPEWKFRTWNDWHSDATALWSFEKTVRGRSTDHFMHGQHFEKGLAGSVAGIPATEYHSVPDVKNSSPEGTKFDTTEERAHVSVWVADEIRIAPQLSKLFSIIYAAPDLKRLPLSVRITDYTGKTIRDIETVSAKQVTLPANTFKPPPYRSPGKVYQPSLFLDKPL